MGGKPAQLARGITPLRNGSQKHSRKPLLLNNPSENNIVLMPNDLIGHCSIAAYGQYCSKWLQTMKALRKLAPTTGRVYNRGVHNIESQPTSEWVNQLVEQLGLENNRLLNDHPKIKSKLI